MINALPFFPGRLGSSIQENGQTGGIVPDQSTTIGNPSDNPFAKILRDQSAVASLFASLTSTVPSEDQRRLPDPQFLPENTDLSLNDLPAQDRTGDVLREGIPESVEWPLSGNVQPHTLQVTFFDSVGLGLREDVDIGPTSLTPLPSSGVAREHKVGNVNIPLDFSPDTSLSGVVFSPQGGSGAVGIQTQNPILKPGFPLLVENSSIQVSPVGRSVADNSGISIGSNSNPQQFLGESVKDSVQLAGSSAGPEPESVVGTGKPAEQILDRLSRPGQDADSMALRISPTSGRVMPTPLNPVVNQAFQNPLPFEETPASLAELVQSNLTRVKYANGSSSLLGESSINGKESTLGVPSDLLRDSSFFSTGDRSKDIFEAAGKGVGVDTNGGQGANNGMGGSPHSQSGFQQFSSSLSPGPGVRMAEERGLELPTPALQRLQMEVQLSETNRVQIEVGVQQRQVYAGLVMDQATLKNLAVQFVPQLEEQLAQRDMDLQEFSAEVRDHHREQESATDPDWRASQQGHWGSTTFSHAQDPHIPSVTRFEERGWHYVA